MTKKEKAWDAASYEQLGSFYLGSSVDPNSGEEEDAPFLYDSKDLTTHAVCVGMTGSGKTGLCVCLLEEALIDGVPAIVVDLKGDLANMLLTFPELRPEDFLPWIDPGEASRAGVSPGDFARKTADLWRSGLAKWGQDGERIRRLRDSADFTIFTPGSSAGVGLSILRSFSPPSPEILADTELLHDRIMATVTGLLTLIGVDADPLQSREHILLSTIFERAWRAGEAADLPRIISMVQRPPFDSVGVLNLESFYPEKERFGLAMRINNMLASPTFAGWMRGDPLDVQRLLWTESGKPRLSILSLAHLDDAERMFFLTLLLNEVISWVRTQPGTGSLRALLYIDEVFGYMPPTANPPSKKPLLTLLKQARAFGLGVVLATQNPVDLDYKGLSNAGTWLIGRLQTERDKLRVLDGLESVSSVAGSGFDRKSMDQRISNLGKRMFILNNVHEPSPALLKTRWALSYLRGPLTREHVKSLMTQRRATIPQQPDAAPLTSGPVAQPESGPPVIPPKISVAYLAPTERIGDDEKITYAPALLWSARLHYADKRRDLYHWVEINQMAMLADDNVTEPWLDARDMRSLTAEENGIDGARYQQPPEAALSAAQYKQWKKELKSALYRDQRLDLLKCAALKLVGKPGELEGDFRARLRLAAHERRDAGVEKVRKSFERKFNSLEGKMATAQNRIDREKSQYGQQKLQTAISIGSTLLGALLGGRRSRSSATTAARGVGRAARERGDIKRAKRQLTELQQDMQDLEALFAEEIERVKAENAMEAFAVETTSIAPRKADIAVQQLSLCWVPFAKAASGGTRSLINPA